MKEKCLCLCDLKLQNQEMKHSFIYTRIYVGSYFCENYFMHFSHQWIEKILNIGGLKVTIVIPCFSQSLISNGKEYIKNLLVKYENIIDEICINDFGMLKWIADNTDKFKLYLGRVFWKSTRDIRMDDGVLFTQEEYNNELLKVLEKYHIYGIEIEELHHLHREIIIPEGLVAAYHYPWCYMTFGRICMYASIHHSLEKKYRAGQSCNFECLSTQVVYPVNGRTCLRMGKGIYSQSQRLNIKDQPLREIVWNAYREETN